MICTRGCDLAGLQSDALPLWLLQRTQNRSPLSGTPHTCGPSPRDHPRRSPSGPRRPAAAPTPTFPQTSCCRATRTGARRTSGSRRGAPACPRSRTARSRRHRLPAARKPLGVLSIDRVELAIQRPDRMQVCARRIGVPLRLLPVLEGVRMDPCPAAELGDGYARRFSAPRDVLNDSLLVHIRRAKGNNSPSQGIFFPSEELLPFATAAK